MKICTKCNQKIPNSYQLCPQCGTDTLVIHSSNKKSKVQSSSVHKNNELANNNKPIKQPNLDKPNSLSNENTLPKPLRISRKTTLVRNPSKKTKHKRIPMLKPWAIMVLIAGCICIFLMVFNAGDTIANWAVNNTSVDDEQLLVAEDIISIKNAAYEASHPSSTALNEIGLNLVNSLEPKSKYEYHFYLVPSDEINAFAMPGGHIVMFEGLYQYLTPEEIAAVLSHEIMHVENQHVLKSYYKSISNGLLLAWITGFKDDVGRDIINYISNSHFSRSLETEADLEGLILMQHAGYDPQAMVDLLYKFDELESDGIESKIPSWLLSHPQSEERAEAVQDAINNDLYFN